MSSAVARSVDGVSDDRTTKARIRDAAITCFARDGMASTTVRKIADAAGVSPGLVIHHFGSMAGLRTACDEHVAATIRHYKQEALSVGPSLDVLAALRGTEVGPLMGYLAAALAEDSPEVARLVDELVSDAEGYLQQGVETGMVRPSADPHGRAAVLLLWSLGALVLHRHVHRILGVDLTAPDVGADPSLAAYAGPAYEIMGEGILTEEFAIQVMSAFRSPQRESDAVWRIDRPIDATDASESTSKETR
jgi:AcrR family transcriptional regulator